MLQIETKRLLLRFPVLEDIDALAEIYSSPQVMRYIGNGSVRTRYQTELAVSWMIEEHIKHGYGLYTTILKSNQTIVGRCGLIHHMINGRPELEIAYMLGPEFWGYGLATEAASAIRDNAVTELRQTRLVSLIHPENIASKRVAEKIGMNYDSQVSLNGFSAELHVLKTA